MLKSSSLLWDKSLYSRLIRLALPMMIQNGITNFVNMLDNIMIGAVGTAEMTGVAIPAPLAAILEKSPVHTGVIDKADMAASVLDFAK